MKKWFKLFAMFALACILVVVGVLLYKEVLTLPQVVGMGLCVAGLVLIGR